jgi:hypothetical protein
MLDTSKIVSHMVVVDSNGHRVGTVDKVEAAAIKLAKFDQTDDAVHHWIPLAWVVSVDQLVHLDRDLSEVHQSWRTQPLAAM